MVFIVRTAPGKLEKTILKFHSDQHQESSNQLVSTLRQMVKYTALINMGTWYQSNLRHTRKIQSNLATETCS